MGHIAEPEGVDFLIESIPLTDKERLEITAFIKKRKAESKKKATIRTRGKERSKTR